MTHLGMIDVAWCVGACVWGLCSGLGLVVVVRLEEV
jgi:hypothetical protein